MEERILGIDLGVTAHHQVAVLNPSTNHFVIKRRSVRSNARSLNRLLALACPQSEEPCRVSALLEATGMSWYLVSRHLQNAGVTVYRVNGRMTRQLRRVATPHAQSDAIDCQVLARLSAACPDHLYPLVLPMADALTLKQAVLEYARWRTQAVAVQNRLTSGDHAFWPGLGHTVPENARNWMRTNWFDPFQVLSAGADTLRAAWHEAEPDEPDDWIDAWLAFTAELSELYGTPLQGMNALQNLNRFHVQQYLYAIEQQRYLMREVILPLYHELYPACPLPTLYGVNVESAAIYRAFVPDISRFLSVAAFRQWCGIVPSSHQSGQAESKGRRMTQAGPSLIKATLYVNANVARQWDPGIAKVYYTQMVDYGKHHTQAVCACASHLANRIHAILKQQRPYVLLDLDGHPISAQDAHILIQQRFSVPDSVRRRTNVHTPPPILDDSDTEEETG